MLETVVTSAGEPRQLAFKAFGTTATSARDLARFFLLEAAAIFVTMVLFFCWNQHFFLSCFCFCWIKDKKRIPRWAGPSRERCRRPFAKTLLTGACSAK